MINVKIKTKDLHFEDGRFVVETGSSNPAMSWTLDDDCLVIKFADGLDADPDIEVEITLYGSQLDKIYRMLKLREQSWIAEVEKRQAREG